MAQALLDCAEIETGADPQCTVLWLHGVGADGHHFESLAQQLVQPGDPAVRFVLPHAPFRPVTLCAGERMRAWYDLRNTDRQLQQDEPAIRESRAQVRALIEREAERGVPSERVVLGGFSQGGAMTLVTGLRYDRPLAGLVALSCYPLLARSFEIERQPANQHTPIFYAHGLNDPVINVKVGEDMREALSRAGYSIEWHSYPIGHELCDEEIAAISVFVRRVLNLARAR
jgi:phospholipase/carboxylesterase